MSLLLRLDRIFARIETAALILTLAAMVLMAFLQVILRNFFSYSILWADVFLRHLVLWVGFLGASLATREQKHINVDALSRLLSDRARRWVRLVTNLFSATVCAFLAKAAYVFVRDERAVGSTLFGDAPLWLFVVIVFIGFACMTFRFLLQALQSVLPAAPPREES